MIKQITIGLAIVVVSTVLFGIFLLNVSFIPVRDGRLYLPRANSTATLLREYKHGVHHIKGDSLEMAVYTQAFAHAQDRFW